MIIMVSFICILTMFICRVGDNKFQSVTKFFQDKFRECNQNDEKNIYVHLTHATVIMIYDFYVICLRSLNIYLLFSHKFQDTKQMRVIVASVNDIVQRRNLKASGLI